MLRLVLIATLILAAAGTGRGAECDPAFAVGLPQVVSKAAVAAVDASYDIELWSFCRGLEFHDLGNAPGLTRTIAANPWLASPIEAKGWRPDDVKFVRIANGRVDLWLHRDP